MHLGFEVRVELETADESGLAVQMSRSEIEQLEVGEGDIVYVRDNGQARRFPRRDRTTVDVPS